MYYLGCDVAKKEHRFLLLNEEGEREGRSFSLSNTFEDFKRLSQRLLGLGLASSNLLIGMEATGNHWENLYSFLTDEGYKVILLNPHQTNKFREALRKKAKTDDIDALIIAGLLRSKEFASSYVPPDKVQSLREFVRARHEFVKDRKNYQRKVYALLSLIFFEYQIST